MSRGRAGGFVERGAEGACPFVQSHPEGAVVSLIVQPGARKTALAGVHDGAVKITVCAPPVEGAANKECLRFLAALVGTAKNRVVLLRGHKSRTKLVLVKGTSAEKLVSIFQAFGLGEERPSPPSNGS
uniref:UPF0235 protein ENS06_08580 n=1 Tax=Desulfacinum infernum TaxID=35837 RepID=A0A832EJB8_9BACT